MLRYIVMLGIVVGLAVADFATGFIKAYVTDSVQSAKMRKGGMNKLGEMIVMLTACGLEVGSKMLGRLSDSEALSDTIGVFASSAIFGYIVLMEIISILENYAEINPEANGWICLVIRKLKSKDKGEEQCQRHQQD